MTQPVETTRLEVQLPRGRGLSLTTDAAKGSSRARLLIVESNEDGTVGGSHQALYDLVLGVDHAQFEPVVLFHDDNVFASRLRLRGIEVVLFEGFRRKNGTKAPSRRLIAKATRFLGDMFRCRRELQRLNVDLLHLNNSPKTGNDNWLLAARSLGIPCIVTAMGDVGRPTGLIHRWLYNRFDLYLAISRHVGDVLRQEGVDSQRIELVYLGVDLENLRKRVVRSAESVRDEIGVGDRLLVVMVGNIRAWKGQREVVAALRLLPRSVLSRILVCFVGATASFDEGYEAALRADISRAGLDDCVQLLGFRLDVPDLYNAADVALHASTSPEPFGLVVPEAMALGCAVIAASSGGPAEVIVPGTGILCDPSRPEEYASAIEQLVRDDQLRESIAAAAPRRAADFSIDKTIEGTTRAYNRALKRPAIR